MGWVTHGLLRLIHVLQSLIILFTSFWQRITRRTPRPLLATRRRLPKHLAILFTVDSHIEQEAEEDRLLDTVADVVHWCQSLGVESVSFYEKSGKLLLYQKRIHQTLGVSEDTRKAKVKGYRPPTPPSSDYADTPRSLSPASQAWQPTFHTFKTRRQKSGDGLRVYLLSERSGKEALAETARSLRVAHKVDGGDVFNLSVAELKKILEDGPDSYPSPDFMIVHPLSPSIYSRQPLEMHAFPPWQSRLTEIHLNRYRRRHRSWLHRFVSPHSEELTLPLTESEFCEALDEFSGAEMRLGK